MANKIPVKAIFNGSDVTSLGEYASGDTIAATYIQGLSGTNTGDQTITLTGEVAGSGTGSFAATVADNIIDEANLKVSNTPTDGYVLTAQSGNTGGLTWEEVPTNYTLPTAAASTLGGVKVGSNLSIDGSGVLSSTDTNTTYTVGDGGLTTNDFTDADHTKLDGIANSANNYSLPTADASTLGGVKVGTNLSIDGSGVLSASSGASYSVGDGGLTTNDFTDADHSKLDGIEASANNYVHPNHSGEVTSSADGATVISDNVVDEANLKVSNTPTNGYVLTAQSGNTGGLTWAEASSGGGGGGDVSWGGDSSSWDQMTRANSDHLLNYALGKDSMANPTWSDAITLGAYRNIAFGHEALMDITTGNRNIAMGYKAGQNITTAIQNTFIGSQAGDGITTSHENVVIGCRAGEDATWTGSGQNVIIGYLANGNEKCTVIGKGAQGNTAVTNNTVIGQSANNASSTGSNRITLGNSQITNLRCNDTSISSLSDERDKTNIQDTTLGLDFIKDVRPVDFTWDRRDGTMGSMKDVGFIAQELWDTELKHSSTHRTRIVQFDTTDRLEAAPNRMFPILVKAVQELATKNEELETRLAALEG
jgi:hypothetical protein